MRHRPLRSALIIALALTGCTQHYTGAISLSPEDKQAVEAYERFKEQQQDQIEATQLADRRMGPVYFNTAEGDLAAAGRPVEPKYISRTADRGIGSLGLYGQIRLAKAPRVSPLDGTGNLRQVSFTSEGADFDPALDATGTRIVYASTRHRDTADIYVKKVSGTAITQLTDDPHHEVMPVFSPDGSQFAFASDRFGNWDIFVKDVRGGPANQITKDVTHDIHPSFSPDGTKLIYCSTGTSSGQWELVLVDLANPTVRRVVGYGLFPTWSPIEDKILFQRARQRGTRWFSVWVFDLVDGEAMRPTEIAVSTNAAVITPDWSPDGRHVVFCTVIDPEADDLGNPGQADVWVAASDGTGRVKLTEGEFSNLQPAWAADGTIYFVSDRGANSIENIWSVRPGSALEMAQPQPESKRSATAVAPTQ